MLLRRNPIDIVIINEMPLELALDLARAADSARFDTIWLAENYYHPGVISLAATVATNTSASRIGLGIISPYTHHPTIIAMEAANLDLLSNGRFALGLGMAKYAVNRMGIANPRPATVLKETTEIVRRFLLGKRFIYEGEFFRITAPGVSLSFKPYRKNLPIYIGAAGEKSLRMAGRLADGVILPTFISAKYVNYAIAQVTKGARDVGRDPKELDMSCTIMFAMDEDGKKAKDLVREHVSYYLGTRASTETAYRFTLGGIRWKLIDEVRNDIRDYLAKGEKKKAMRAVPDEILDQMTISGTPRECYERITEYIEGGLQGVGLYPHPSIGRRILPMIEKVKSEILEKLRRRANS